MFEPAAFGSELAARPGGASSLQPKLYMGFNIGSGCKLDVLVAAAFLTAAAASNKVIHSCCSDSLQHFSFTPKSRRRN